MFPIEGLLEESRGGGKEENDRVSILKHITSV
jgi:hypothetical protein